MKSIFSRKLRTGDKIVVIAPSNSYQGISTRVERVAIRELRKIGLSVMFGENLNGNNLLKSTSVTSRVKDLHHAFKDKSIKGIVAASGGNNTNEILQYIDWNLIKKNPKPFFGYSDITVLSNAIYAMTGIVTYSGPNFVTFGKSLASDYIKEYFKKCLILDESYEIFSNSKIYDYKKIIKNRGYDVIQRGIARGISIGGNLCSLNLLQGTAYMPSLRGSILFLEDDDLVSEHFIGEFNRNLQSLLHLKDAQYIKGIVFGRFQVKTRMDITKLRFIVKTKKELKKIPIVANANFGHTDPIFTFPIGGVIEIIAHQSGSSIRIIKH